MPHSPYEWPEYLLYMLFAPFTKPEPIGANPIGARWGVWPLYFEEYRSDTEPPISSGGPNRFVIWQRPTRTDTPAGWWRIPFSQSNIYLGYHDLAENYADRWRPHARHYRNYWLHRQKNITHVVEPASYETFADAFAISTVAKEIPTYELRKLHERLRLFPDRVSIWTVRRKSDNKIIGGLSAFHSLENKASHYGCGFYVAEARRERPMIALMDTWFEYALKQGFTILHLGLFLPPRVGSGRGRTISDFKAQFITTYLHYQPPLVRFVRGTIVR